MLCNNDNGDNNNNSNKVLSNQLHEFYSVIVGVKNQSFKNIIYHKMYQDNFIKVYFGLNFVFWSC